VKPPGSRRLTEIPSDCLVVTQHRYRNQASEATGTGGGVQDIGQPRIGLGIGDIERGAIANGASVRLVGLEREWVARPLGSVASVVEARERDQLDLIGHDPGQPTRIGPQQANGAGQDRVKHRLNVRR
jgi:hypothetical protein